MDQGLGVWPGGSGSGPFRPIINDVKNICPKHSMGWETDPGVADAA
jgi:hypothetical protein